MNERYGLGTATVSPVAGSGFDWADAGIGIAVVRLRAARWVGGAARPPAAAGHSQLFPGVRKPGRGPAASTVTRRADYLTMTGVPWIAKA